MTSPSSRRRIGTRPDGGRYIGTSYFNIIRDPDEGSINCGTYRVMIHDAKMRRFLHLARQARPPGMRDKYKARNEPMPVAVVCGGDPHDVLDGLQRGALSG